MKERVDTDCIDWGDDVVMRAILNRWYANNKM